MKVKIELKMEGLLKVRDKRSQFPPTHLVN